MKNKLLLGLIVFSMCMLCACKGKQEETSEPAASAAVEETSPAEKEPEEPAQEAPAEEPTDLPEEEPEEEYNAADHLQDFEGNYVLEYDGSTIALTYTGMSTYDVEISLFRLCSLEGMGRVDGDRMELKLTDPNDEEMGAEFVKNADGTYDLNILDSTWELLPNGESFAGFVVQTEE